MKDCILFVGFGNIDSNELESVLHHRTFIQMMHIAELLEGESMKVRDIRVEKHLKLEIRGRRTS